MDDTANECFEWWHSKTLDNLLPKQKVHSGNVNNLETDSGISASDYRIADEEMPSIVEMRPTSSHLQIMPPEIVINEDEGVDQIEIAKIESYYERIQTPEGNVKYKNYRVLAPAPPALRMYSPSGDIHTSPKKGKIVPKFDLFHDSLFPRAKLLALIKTEQLFGSMELKAIIKPPGISRQATELLRNTTKSSMDDRMEFLSGVFSKSPSSLSIMSEDSQFMDRSTTPSPCLENVKHNLFMSPTPCLENAKHNLLKSHSIDVDESITEPHKLLPRRNSNHCLGENITHHMNLSDELKQADNQGVKSCTRKMTDFEYSFFHRPSLVLNKSERKTNSQKPRESKRALIRNFVQRNMIERAAHREKLAKLALAIEEDCEFDGFTFVSSAQHLEDRIDDMLDEVKDLRSELIEIQDDIHVSQFLKFYYDKYNITYQMSYSI